MISKKFTIQNKTGIHARPASLFVKTASGFKSDITVLKGEKKGFAKSIISVLALGIIMGDTIEITIDGPDEAAAMKALGELIDSKFGE